VPSASRCRRPTSRSLSTHWESRSRR
jgi:hypothetical protein